jgi:hypothetical protein
VKPQRKNYAPRGVGIGFGIFVLLAAVCLLTPLRRPLLAVAGRDTPALTLRLEAQRDTMDALQTRASERHLAPAERAALEQARDGYAATRERIDARARMNARFSLFGLFDWIRELFPWLVAFGLALPVLGGLIGAQVRADSRPPLPARSHPDTDAANPPSVPLDRPRPVPPVTPAQAGAPPAPRPAAPVRQPYVHPAVAAAATAIPPAVPAHASPLRPADAPSRSVAQRPLPGSPVILPPDIVTPAAPSGKGEETPPQPPAAPAEAPAQDWGFRHTPTPLETRPRPKMPPVRSPHSLDEGVSDDPEEHLAG